MKKLLLFLICLLFISNPIIKVNSENNYYAKEYILIDGYDNEILEGKDYHNPLSVASISKIMTALLAVESDKLFYSYEVPIQALNIEGSSIYLKEGEKYRLIDLVYGLLLRSGNDAAYAISIITSGSTSLFVDRMNNRAKSIGMINTYFSNPCGLDIYDNGNISTAYDIALLMKECLKNEIFQDIIKTKKHVIGSHVYINKNKLVNNYEHILGSKTGYTFKAKRTLVSAAKKDDQYLIMVTLNCSNDYNFHIDTYDRYFNTYSYIIFLKEGINYIDEYYFVAPYVVGLRLKKEIAKCGIKKYVLNTDTRILTISFIDENGNEYHLKKYPNITLT